MKKRTVTAIVARLCWTAGKEIGRLVLCEYVGDDEKTVGVAVKMPEFIYSAG
jgi:hypothetical protein